MNFSKIGLDIKIRLHGIDAPESNQDFGHKSKQFLSDEILGKVILVEDGGNDRYGRIIGQIYQTPELSGLFVNEKLLRANLEWQHKSYDENPD